MPSFLDFIANAHLQSMRVTFFPINLRPQNHLLHHAVLPGCLTASEKPNPPEYIKTFFSDFGLGYEPRLVIYYFVWEQLCLSYVVVCQALSDVLVTGASFVANHCLEVGVRPYVKSYLADFFIKSVKGKGHRQHPHIMLVFVGLILTRHEG